MADKLEKSKAGKGNVEAKLFSAQNNISTSATDTSPSISSSSPQGAQDHTSSTSYPVPLRVEYAQWTTHLHTTPSMGLYPNTLDLDIDISTTNPITEHVQLTAWLYETSKEKLPFSEWFEQKNWKKEKLERL